MCVCTHSMNTNLSQPIFSKDNKRDERKKMADEDALKKIKQLEEQKYELQKQVASQKVPAEGAWQSNHFSRPFAGSAVCVILYRLLIKI